MTDFNYKKYSLEKLEEWMHDAMSAAEATPQEIYDVIKGVVEENYYTYKHQASQAYELLALLNGNGKGHLSCDKDNTSSECKGAWSSFWEEDYYPEEHKGSTVSSVMPPWGHSDMEALKYTDEELNAMCDAAEKANKVKKWVLPVEETKIAETDETEYFVSFPDDLLEAANLKEGDQIEWIDQGDGSYLLKKVEKQMTYDEAIAAGWEMTADGFWIKAS